MIRMALKKRREYLGKTLGINSKQGREVLYAALQSGKLDISALDKNDIAEIRNKGLKISSLHMGQDPIKQDSLC